MKKWITGALTILLGEMSIAVPISGIWGPGTRL